MSGKTRDNSTTLIASSDIGMSDAPVIGVAGRRSIHVWIADASLELEHLSIFLVCEILLNFLLEFKEPKIERIILFCKVSI